MLRIELLDWETARAEASRIRYAVFVEEQRVPREMELDELDPQCVHALAFPREGVPVATGRLLPDSHIGRMAVLKDWRGRGIGGALLERLVAAARARGDREVALSAQTHALEFYRRHQFLEEGETYLDAGIPHRMMRRPL
ncbi:MAG: GNAT family N-acetyltransferase [Betaproteobacteria bacterium RIFCSPLOWO2_12_FULL_67_28]|nr:MAG: GNAT family N-acetyltransferase [Betaproteobacteria bacterium RIFCSPLOWO2_02_FULL_68_150]OGA55371.1 MAG: GNAT family N-acetyltransferase [Betaproteobacteria bacterium RIFCSPLOWO2_12_FULL_67_28]